MKKTIKIVVFCGITALITACADLGFGVDVDSQGANPYWYGNGYIGSNYWNTPVWNYGPIYNQRPPRPPYVAPPAVIIPPTPQRPQAPVQPQRPIVNVRPTVNGVSMGHNPPSIPQGRPLE